MLNDNTPILVACAQHTDKSDSPQGPTPIEMMQTASLAAVQDAGCDTLLKQIDTLAVLGLTVDAVGIKNPLSGLFSNVPKSLANSLKINPSHLLYVTTGGNTPQQMVNHFAAQIANGEAEVVMLSGGEALHTMRKRFNHWSKLLLPKGKWRDKPGGKPTLFGSTRTGCSAHEKHYGLDLPANVYPLFENALRIKYQHSHQAHRQYIGELFAGLSKIAADNPNAWFQQAHSAEHLITETAQNRIIAYPYTKLLNSMIYVNQAASVILTSVGKAKSLGISSDKWVYLHGCADANDIWNVSERVNFHSSPALRQVGKSALQMAGKSIDEIAHLDIYSCFPSAVQVACDELNINHQDSRALSLTGGLPYFGGPGNCYSLLAIAQMMQVLRENPSDYGLLNANGWFLTKHSVGVYSNQPLKHSWRRPDNASLQHSVLASRGPGFVEQARGAATLETFTVVHDAKSGVKRGIVFGRLENQTRFLAELAGGEQAAEQLVANDAFDISGHVTHQRNKNLFSLD